jgi:hypothetical protein
VCREALPGQAAIGELRAATQALQGRQDADGTRLAAVQSEAASLHASIQARSSFYFSCRPCCMPCPAQGMCLTALNKVGHTTACVQPPAAAADE